jgi:CBS domain-containing protein
MLVKHVLESRRSDILTIGPTATLERLMQVLAARNLGAALVVHDDLLLGLVSERDVVRRLALDGKWALDLQVAAIMTRVDEYEITDAIEHRLEELEVEALVLRGYVQAH